MTQAIVDLLNQKYEQFNQPDFIAYDPISIPHQYSRKQDIEISAFFASILAWGQRKTIINKCSELFNYMDNSPYDFIKNHKDSDLKRFLEFKHRTFNATDTLYFIAFLNDFYQNHDSLEDAFHKGMESSDVNVKKGLVQFKKDFFSLEYAPIRTQKHISTPANQSACKRLNMFLRWMVRQDNKGVDFGIWTNISSHQLICPCDVHVERVARKLGLLQREKLDWQAAEELTENLKQLDPFDPCKYDFALFGLGVEGYL